MLSKDFTRRLLGQFALPALNDGPHKHPPYKPPRAMQRTAWISARRPSQKAQSVNDRRQVPAKDPLTGPVSTPRYNNDDAPVPRRPFNRTRSAYVDPFLLARTGFRSATAHAWLAGNCFFPQRRQIIASERRKGRRGKGTWMEIGDRPPKSERVDTTYKHNNGRKLASIS